MKLLNSAFSGYLLCGLLNGVCSPVSFAGTLSDLSQTLENKLLEKLAEAKKGAHIKPFTSDACSGGLSDGWETLSDMFPPFNAHFGRVPPWQDCCVAHDKVYWQGETEKGYEKRKQADKVLEQCVMDTGLKLAPELARRYPFSESEIERGFNMVATLMYRAVRLGGRPCSGLPWRWGYGWPQCRFLPEDKDGDY